MKRKHNISFFKAFITILITYLLVLLVKSNLASFIFDHEVFYSEDHSDNSINIQDLAYDVGQKDAASQIIAKQQKQTSKILGMSKDMNKVILGEKVSYFSNNGVQEIVFPWQEHVPAAVFSKSGNIYVFFSKFKHFTLPQDSGGLTFRQYSSKSKDYSLIIISGHKGKTWDVYKINEAWVVSDNIVKSMRFDILENADFGLKNTSIPAKIININSINDLRSIYIPTQQAESLISVNDPTTGKSFLVVPFYRLNYGVEKKRSFVDFDILSSAQGLALDNRSDNTRVIVNIEGFDPGVLITSANLFFRNAVKKTNINKEPQKQNKKLLPQRNIYSIAFKHKNLQVKNQDFLDSLQAIKDELYHSRKEKSKYNNLLIKLGDFYFENALYAEASSFYVKAFKSTTVKNLAQYHKFMLRTIISLIESGQFAFANNYIEVIVEDQEFANYENKSEYLFWRGYNNILLGDYSSNVNYLENADGFLVDYPEKLKLKLSLLDAREAISVKDLRRAELLLPKINKNWTQTISELNAFYLLKAKYLLLKHKSTSANGEERKEINFFKTNDTDQLNKAKQIFASIAGDVVDHSNRAEAIYELTKMLYENNTYSVNKALKEFEHARFVATDKKNLYEILGYMAKLYEKNEDYIQALRTYKYILNSFDNIVSNIFISRDMMNLYDKIFGPKGISNNMEDYKAISAFYEFRELTPVGDEGDEIVVSIAKRLINLDLLNKAKSLLEHQVLYRQEGREKIKIANLLGYLYLNSQEPQKTIDIIDNTDSEDYNYATFMQRNRLRAKAFIDLQKYEKAESIIKGDESKYAKNLKIELYFKKQDWQSLINILKNEYEIGKLMEDKKLFSDLSDKSENDLMLLMISYSNLGMLAEINEIYRLLPQKAVRLKEAAEFFMGGNNQIDIDNLKSSIGAAALEDFIEEIEK